MILGAAVCGIIGAVCLIPGWLLWKKERITVLHDYHYDKVTEENKKPFCTLSGIGLTVVGIGLIITAVLLVLTESVLSFLAFAVGFTAGLALRITAGVKYNR